jgi:SAM-dependent methyltransferase
MSSDRRLELVSSWERNNEIMESHIRNIAPPGRQLQILEAGCGQAWPIDLRGVDYVLTGLDLDKTALDLRLNNSKDLHKAIVGDLRTVTLPEASFDVIYSSFVLEHIAGAESVMHSFRQWIKPGGIIVLRVPDPQSVQGFVTRVTPHWFHVLYYRLVLKQPLAGTAGYAPYPVHYDPVIWRDGMKEFCQRNGLKILAEYGDGYLKPGKGLVKGIISAVKRAVSALSLGRLDYRHTNLLYILQRE